MESSTPPVEKAALKPVKKASKAKKTAKKKSTAKKVESPLEAPNKVIGKQPEVPFSKTEQESGNSEKEASEKASSKPSNEKEEFSQDSSQQQESQGRRPRRPRSGKKKNYKVNPQELSDKSWQVFLAEVSEEGLSLVGAKEAQEVARKSLEVTKIYLETRDRQLAVKSSASPPHQRDDEEQNPPQAREKTEE